MVTREMLEDLANKLDSKAEETRRRISGWESPETRELKLAIRKVYSDIAEMIRSTLPPKDGVYR